MASKRLTGEERREQLVLAAARLFSAKNYRSATMVEIAEEAQVSEALLFSHFGSKKSLYIEALRASHHRLDEVWAGTLARRDMVVYDLLLELTRLTFQYIKASSQFVGLFLKLPAELEDPDVRAVFEDLFITKFNLLKALVARGVEEGSLRPGLDPTAVAWLLVNGLHVFLYTYEFKREELFNEKSLVGMTRTILGG